MRVPGGKPARWSSFDLVEAFHLAHAAAALHDANVFDSLTRPSTAGALARRQRLDPALLRGALEFVAARTDLLRKNGATFAVGRGYSAQARFLLNLYTGAFRPNAMRLPELLRRPSRAPAAIDRAMHARAFDGSSPLSHAPLAALVRRLQFTRILDVGCGSGGLLVELAAANSGFEGWGIERNPALCSAARARARARHVGRRVHILEGDARRLRSLLPADARKAVQGVIASQVANEMFGTGTARAVAWLRGLRAALSGRPLFVSDYYGRLGADTEGRDRETLLHDYAQVISGQGVPPPRMADWRAIYAEAGCRLVHVLADRATTRFIHIVLLDGLDSGASSRQAKSRTSVPPRRRA